MVWIAHSMGGMHSLTLLYLLYDEIGTLHDLNGQNFISHKGLYNTTHYSMMAGRSLEKYKHNLI